MNVGLSAYTDNKTGLSATVSRISRGALEMMDVYSLDEKDMIQMKGEGYIFIGSGMGRGSLDIKDREAVQEIV
jgi:tRNA G18 (ribose-2'-O)-methylase SpoU